jgi:hypothetical protein
VVVVMVVVVVVIVVSLARYRWNCMKESWYLEFFPDFLFSSNADCLHTIYLKLLQAEWHSCEQMLSVRPFL